MTTGGFWLAIESGGDDLGVAVVRSDRAGIEVLDETVAPAPRSHARLLMQTVAAALARADVGPTDVEAIAVALGPGSYTGLRVGIATALGWATAARVRTVGVPSLRLAAYGGAEAGDEAIVSLLAAGRGGVYAQNFCWPRESPRPVENGAAQRLDGAAVDAWLAHALSGGRPVRVVAPGLALDAPPGAAWRPPARPFDRLSAADVARLAILDVEEESDGHGQALALAPIYLRPAATQAGA